MAEMLGIDEELIQNLPLDFCWYQDFSSSTLSNFESRLTQAFHLLPFLSRYHFIFEKGISQFRHMPVLWQGWWWRHQQPCWCSLVCACCTCQAWCVTMRLKQIPCSSWGLLCKAGFMLQGSVGELELGAFWVKLTQKMLSKCERVFSPWEQVGVGKVCGGTLVVDPLLPCCATS